MNEAETTTNTNHPKESDGAARHVPVNTFEALLERKIRAAAASNVVADEARPRPNAQGAAGVSSDTNTIASNAPIVIREGIDATTNRDEDIQITNTTDDLPHDSQEMFDEHSIQTAPSMQPQLQADSLIMEAIAQQGIPIDESGAIPAFVPDATTEARVIGVIESDEELERLQRKDYMKFMLKAILCIVILVVVVAVPVTLKTRDNADDVEYRESPPTEMPSSMPSESPTLMPSSVQFTQVVETLMPLSGDKLMEVGSPQFKAARWIAEEDPMQLHINDSSFEQRYVMAVLYYSLDGDNWGATNWLSGESECDWQYVGGSTPECLDGCIDGDVCSFVFPRGYMMPMKGTLPNELVVLTEMRYFEMQDQDITGTIPNQIGSSWTKLHSFFISGNDLDGSYPFSENSSLGTVLMNYNKIEDDVASLFSSKNLVWMEAEGNRLNGTLPESMAQLQYLDKVKLANNSISGAIPNTWTSVSLLEYLDLSNNKLKGSLPNTLASSPNLKKLHVSNNLLSGSIPSSLYSMQGLEDLYIDQNTIGGSLSQLEEPLYSSIKEFVVNDNLFEGRFPADQFEKNQNLNKLALQNNQLTGTISESICQHFAERTVNDNYELSVDCGSIDCTCCVCY